VSSTRIEHLIDDAQAAFDRRPTEVESGLDVEDAALLQLRKACRLLTGAGTLREASYDTLVIEASFVAIERTVEFRLLERGTMQPNDLPGTHPDVYRRSRRLPRGRTEISDFRDDERRSLSNHLTPGLKPTALYCLSLYCSVWVRWNAIRNCDNGVSSRSQKKSETALIWKKATS